MHRGSEWLFVWVDSARKNIALSPRKHISVQLLCYFFQNESAVCVFSVMWTNSSFSQTMQITWPWRWLIKFSTAFFHVASQSRSLSCCTEFRVLPLTLWLLRVRSPAVMFPLAMLTRAHIGVCLLHSTLICQSKLACSWSSLNPFNNQEHRAADRTFTRRRMGSLRQTSHSVIL